MNTDIPSEAAFPPELVCPAVSTDVAAFMLKREEKRSYRKNASSRLGILLIRRGIPPFLGQWALPGGFLRAEETVEECALREIGEDMEEDIPLRAWAEWELRAQTRRKSR